MFSNAEVITMQLSGVYDAATGKAAAQALRQVDGVRAVSVDSRNAVAQVTFMPSKTSVDTLTAALADAGFDLQ